jgi:hypothetical protein
MKPQGFQASGPEVSGEKTSVSTSLSRGYSAKLIETVERTLTGQLIETVLVPVLPSFQDILGKCVWFCPDLAMAEEKAPDLAFTSEELIVIIPLLIENRELASALVSAKKILGGTIMDSSLLDSPTAEPHGRRVGSADYQALEGNCTVDHDVYQPLDNNLNHQDSVGIPSPRGGLIRAGRHLVKIISVKGQLHNFKEYTGPRALIEMEVLHGSDSGKIIIDKVRMPHSDETKGMLHRRVRIACRLGLIPWGIKETVQVNWKLLEGVTCWVDVAYKTLGGRKVLTVDNYELQ